jgi:GT2 family glycosyltransferase
MATQSVQCDVHAIPQQVRLRDDVESVLIVVTDAGRPIELQRVPRPSDGRLTVNRSRRSSDLDMTSGARTSRQTVAALSIVVCTHERPDDLSRCLESLLPVHARGHEVVVVDSGPVTTRTRAIVGRFPFRYITESRPGLNRARNAGLGAATHEIVAFLDDDVVVGEGWVTATGSCFEAADVGCVTGLVLPLELETRAQEEFELYCQHRRDFQRKLYTRQSLRPSAAGVVGMGANMAFRRDLVRALGGFDERLDAGTRTRSGGDTDMFARVLESGCQIVYTPDAPVWHRHRRSTRELRSCVFGYGVGLFSMLTKRVVEQRDGGTVITAARWLVGPPMKAAWAKMTGKPAPGWSVVLSETAGAVFGPFMFAYETWRHRSDRELSPRPPLDTVVD